MSRHTDLEAEARRLTDEVANDPGARLALREAFYDQYGEALINGDGLGNSEIAFMTWELERGVLDPLADPTPGSAWWRDVNSDLIFQCLFAELLYEDGLDGAGAPPPTRRWMEFIADPSPQAWYRAHNASIVDGYFTRRDHARNEDLHEQHFMLLVLNRLLFAQAIVEGSSLAFGHLGEVLANPRLPAVQVLVSMPDFYPRHYPLTPDEIEDIEGRSCGVEEFARFVLDKLLISPNVAALYKEAAGWLQDPRLPSLIVGGDPVYP